MHAAHDLVMRLRNRASQRPARVVLPEGDEPRVVAGAAFALQAGIAAPLLLGEPAAIAAAARQAGVSLEGLSTLDPATSPLRPALAERYCAARGRQAPSLAEACEALEDRLLFATMLLHANEAAGLLAGARSTTAQTIEPALRLRTLRPGLGPIASSFIMLLPSAPEGASSPAVDASVSTTLVFADCALNPDPSPAMLAQIAIAAAQTARTLCELEPRVALLSFSTHGSAKHERVDKVQRALEELKKRAPELAADGELQADAALVAAVARQKVADSAVADSAVADRTVAGRANVLVFPSLEAGNIAYKLVQRLAGARAIGPIFSGLNWPVNDLSRGCSVDDVVDMLAVTSIMAQDAGA